MSDISIANDAPDMAKFVENIAGGNIPPPADAPRRYTVRGLWDIARIDLPPLTYVWNGIALTHGAIIEIIGAPGIGKSRVIGDLARHQILGRTFGGRETSKNPIKWLFAGSENGINRLNYETIRYLFHRSPAEMRGKTEEERLAIAAENGFSRSDIIALDANFRTFTLENPDDFDISLACEENVEKLVETLKAEMPKAIVFDPWGDAIAGKELDDADVRGTIRIMRNCLAKAGMSETMIFVVNHARMGAKEEASARGTDEGNFGKNSKCLYSIARYVINIRRGSFDDNADVELINAKNNDGRKQPPIALHLDAESMSYELIPDFDHDAWQSQLDEAAGNNARKRGGTTQTDKQYIWESICDALKKADGGVLTYGELNSVLRNTYGIKKTAAEDFISSCRTVGKSLFTTSQMKEGKDGTWVCNGNSTLYGLPHSIEEYERKHAKGGEC